MKKTLLIVCITIFLFTGCAEEKSSFSANIPPVDTISDKLKGLAGTYKITFFGSEITNINDANNSDLFETYNDYYITNNCQKALELFPDIINKNNKNKCDGFAEINLLTSDAVIYFIKNQISLRIKLQAENGIVEKCKTYKYQYITSSLSDKLSGSGIREDYYDTVSNGVSNISYEYTGNDYIITKIDEKTVKLDIFYAGKDIFLDAQKSINVDTKNTYILEKIDNDTIELITSNDYPF